MLDWLVAALAALAAEPDALEREAPRAEAAVACAYASLLVDAPAPAPAPPAPGPKPPAPARCDQCNGTGYIVHGDGHRTVCPCRSSCPDGRCPTPRGPTP
jgi:hypothetical protein